MITLPVVTSGTKVSSTATASGTQATDTDSDFTAAGTDIKESGQAKGTQGFLAVLGSKLQSLVKQNETSAQTTAATDATDSTTPAKAKLNALLAALDKPETLNALLQPQTAKTGTTSTDTDKEETQNPATALNASDMQTLQALFAMLPPAVNQPATAAAAKGSEALSADASGKGVQTTLGSLLAASGTTTGDADKGVDKSGKTVAASTASAVTATQNSPADTSLNAAFQQVMSHTGKEGEKDNSSSASSTTINSNAIAALSSAATPTTTSLVTAPATPALNAQLGSQEWQQALGQQIIMFSRNGQQTAELHLHPQDLGSIQISLKLDNDQAQLNMVSGHSQVRAALEAAMPQLRTALAESGISLGQSNVSSDAFQQSQSSGSQQQQQRNNSGGSTFSLSGDSDGDITPIAVPAALQARAAGSSAVDIFA
ncbi:flagellar hook-length control protein FliK [Erwinia tasmaniensis]|uniref:flagellar hook-length control protein FliK n=1 Tax=Erwinia tasmaniensis TaxID=338565 RepID=UPI003A4E1ADF